ncbi:MAG: glycosyltransferase [Acidobacteriota bacterium]
MLTSVIIPTFNRCSTLLETLGALANQSYPKDSYEVLVVDDGSSDRTAPAVARLQPDYPVPLHYLFQPNRKQGAARNLGARTAAGPRILFLGDDIVPGRDLLIEHERAHGRFSDDERVAVIGYTTWPASFRRTRFLEYIGEQGWQFGFSLIKHPDDVPFNFLYTSNLSLSREFFFEAGGFDEGFREYGWEDIELSLRLKERGMRLVYANGAVAYHHHPISLGEFSERQRQVGRSAWKLYERHPDMASFLSIDRIPSYGRVDHIRMRILGLFCRLTEKLDPIDLSRYYPDLMSYYYLQGLIEARPGGEGPETGKGRP